MRNHRFSIERRCRTRSPVLAAIALSLVLGCQYDPHAHTYTSERPADSAVVDTYRLNSVWLPHHDVEDFDRRPCILDLRADGSFSADNVPQRDADADDPRFLESLVSGSGRWSVQICGSVDDGWSECSVYGVRLDFADESYVTAQLTGDEAPYGLNFLIGDPDSGHALMLARAP